MSRWLTQSYPGIDKRLLFEEAVYPSRFRSACFSSLTIVQVLIKTEEQYKYNSRLPGSQK